MKSLSARGLALSLIFSTAHARAEDRNWICQKPDLPVIAQTPPARSAEPFPIILGRPLPGSHESGSQPSILDPRITRVSFQIDPSETNEIWKPAKKPLVEAAGSASPSAGDAARPPENPRDMLPDPFAVTPQPRASPAEPAAPLNGVILFPIRGNRSPANHQDPRFAGFMPVPSICCGGPRIRAFLRSSRPAHRRPAVSWAIRAQRFWSEVATSIRKSAPVDDSQSATRLTAASRGPWRAVSFSWENAPFDPRPTPPIFRCSQDLFLI